MTSELKTMKELEDKHVTKKNIKTKEIERMVSVKDLKDGAIKEIKFLQQDKGAMELQKMGFSWSREGRQLTGDHWREAIEEYIKWKFNIKELDLNSKEVK